MNDYMRALHQRFFQEPGVRTCGKRSRLSGRNCGRPFKNRSGGSCCGWWIWAQNLLREETSLASFMAGFKLAWGSPEAGTLTRRREEERALRRTEQKRHEGRYIKEKAPRSGR